MPILSKIEATASTWIGSPQCDAAMTAISRDRETEALRSARFDDRGGDERFRRRAQIDRSVDIARAVQHAAAGIDRASGDVMHRLDEIAARYLDAKGKRVAQTSAGSTIVASCSLKTGLLR